ncbi:MAG: DUF5717 family protein [Lachnospiraceae bacterium]|nr:DUF5717 family protein [Lachnospiraceae bacterium]
MIKTYEDMREIGKEEGGGILSELSFEARVGVGNVYRDKLRIKGRGNSRLSGEIFVSNPRIRVKEKKIKGIEQELPFLVNTEGLSEGESAEGEIILSSNEGEYRVPVSVHVLKSRIICAGREISDLDAFVKLAQEKPAEALMVFQSEEFMKLLAGEEPYLTALASGLRRSPVTRRDMEEFLTAGGKKEALILSLDGGERVYPAVAGSLQEEVRIVKNTWGCADISVEAEGDFLYLPKTKFSAEDFFGSVLDVEYIIREDRLFPGANYGCLRFSYAKGVLVVPVTAYPQKVEASSAGPNIKKIKMEAAGEYTKYLRGLISAGELAQQMRNLVSPWESEGKLSLPARFMLSYAEILAGRPEKAGELLQDITPEAVESKSVEIRGMYLFVRYLLEADSGRRREFEERIGELQARNQENLIVTLIRLRTDRNLLRMPDRRMVYYYSLFDAGSRSPLLYLAALQYYREYPEMFVRVDDFIWHMLTYAAKSSFITEELALKVSYLVVNDKKTGKDAFYVLSRAYELYPSDDILEAICRLLVRIAPDKPESFPWFLLAVRKEIPVVRLYQCFLESMPESCKNPLPPVIQRYFAQNIRLQDEKQAFIFANIVKNREIDQKQYLTFVPKMRTFAAGALKAGRIGRDYAILYREFCGNVRTAAEGLRIAGNIFSERLYTDDSRVKAAAVWHRGFKAPEIYPLNKGEAFIRVYTEDAAILFLDSSGGCLASSVASSREMLMEKEPLLSACRSLDIPYPGLWLHTVSEEGRLAPVSIRNVDAYRHIEESEAFTDSFRDTVRGMLLAYYLENAGNETLSRYLAEMDLLAFARIDRVRFLTLLLKREMYGAAFGLIRRCGFEGIEPKLLLALTGFVMEEIHETYDETLLALAGRLLTQGEKSEKTLRYLEAWYDSSVDDLLSLRETLRENEVRCAKIDERLLRRAVFTDRLLPNDIGLISEYESLGGDAEILDAYVKFECEKNFAGETVIGEETAARLFELIDRKMSIGLISRLSMLHYYAKKEELDSREELQLDSLLEECMAKGLRFSFLKELPDSFLRQYHLDDKVFVQVKAESEDEVMISYAISSEGEEGERRRIPLREMYKGFFVKEFILFYGETLTWSAEIRRGKEVIRLEERTETAGSVDEKGVSRYQLLNQMLAARDKGDLETLKARTLELKRAELEIDALFKLEETK